MFLGAFLGFAAAATVAVSAWLFWVVTILLPRHNPDQIPFWTAVAIGFLAFGLLTWVYLFATRAIVLRLLLGVGALAGVAGGAYAIATQVIRAGRAQDFEGYLLLMGAILATHGALLLAHLLRPRPVPARMESARL